MAIKGLIARNKKRLRFIRSWQTQIRRMLVKAPIGVFAGAFRLESPPVNHIKTEDYFNQKLPNDALIPVYDSETYRRRPPFTRDGFVDWRFRLCLEETGNPASVSVLNRGRYWGYHAGAVITQSNQMLAEPSREVWDIDLHKAFTVCGLPLKRKITGTVAVLTTGEADRNYWHWMFDLLPRIHLLRKAGFNNGNIDYYLINHRGLPYQKQTLRLLGIPDEQIIVPSARDHIEADTLIVPSLRRNPTDVPFWMVEFIRKIRTSNGYAHTNNSPKRVYISRRNCLFRRLINEEEIIPTLLAHGFHISDLDSLSVAEQWNLFAGAEVIVAPHGAALTNCVFCQPGTKIIELVSPNYVYPCFWAMGYQIPLNHYCLFGEGKLPVEGFDPAGITDDILIDHMKLKGILNDIIA